MKNSQNKQVMKFLSYLTKLEVIEAVGLARLLDVDLLIREDGSDVDSESTATITEKEYDVILSEIIDAFVKCNKTKRKNILALLKVATSEV